MKKLAILVMAFALTASAFSQNNWNTNGATPTPLTNQYSPPHYLQLDSGSALSTDTSFFTANAGLVGPVIDSRVANGKQPFRSVVNVKAAPYNAKGDGVSDDWFAIQSAITAACLATNGGVSVYIPAGSYRLTNTLAITTQSNSLVGLTGNTSISELFGDGARRSILNFTKTNLNGLEFRVQTNDPRHLSNFSLHDLAVIGPAVSGNTNVFGQGVFLGYDGGLPYGGDAAGWQDTVRDCWIGGWQKGLCVTNLVFLKVQDCDFSSNLVYCVYLTHCDTWISEQNLYGFSVGRISNPGIAQVGLAIERDISGISGQGGTSLRDEFGDYGTAVSVDGCNGGVSIAGGNCERAGSFLMASNYCNIAVQGMQLSGCTNYFHFKSGGASGFWAEGCAINDGVNPVFNQESGNGVNELPIHHALNTILTNGLYNGVIRSYPPVFYQTPRWTHSYQLAEVVNVNCSALTPSVTSPSPYFSADGVSINNTTGELWLPIPSGLGANLTGNNLENVRFTALIQGGAGATNAFVTLNTLANRKNPNTGDATDQSPSFTISGITNGMCKVFSWTNSWSATSDSNPRYGRFHFVTTNQIYLIGINAETIDY
jgi:hypothetical protein